LDNTYVSYIADYNNGISIGHYLDGDLKLQKIHDGQMGSSLRLKDTLHPPVSQLSKVSENYNVPDTYLYNNVYRSFLLSDEIYPTSNRISIAVVRYDTKGNVNSEVSSIKIRFEVGGPEYSLLYSGIDKQGVRIYYMDYAYSISNVDKTFTNVQTSINADSFQDVSSSKLLKIGMNPSFVDMSSRGIKLQFSYQSESYLFSKHERNGQNFYIRLLGGTALSDKKISGFQVQITYNNAVCSPVMSSGSNIVGNIKTTEFSVNTLLVQSTGHKISYIRTSVQDSFDTSGTANQLGYFKMRHVSSGICITNFETTEFLQKSVSSGGADVSIAGTDSIIDSSANSRVLITDNAVSGVTDTPIFETKFPLLNTVIVGGIPQIKYKTVSYTQCSVCNSGAIIIGSVSSETLSVTDTSFKTIHGISVSITTLSNPRIVLDKPVLYKTPCGTYQSARIMIKSGNSDITGVINKNELTVSSTLHATIDITTYQYPVLTGTSSGTNIKLQLKNLQTTFSVDDTIKTFSLDGFLVTTSFSGFHSSVPSVGTQYSITYEQNLQSEGTVSYLYAFYKYTDGHIWPATIYNVTLTPLMSNALTLDDSLSPKTLTIKSGASQACDNIVLDACGITGNTVANITVPSIVSLSFTTSGTTVTASNDLSHSSQGGNIPSTKSLVVLATLADGSNQVYTVDPRTVYSVEPSACGNIVSSGTTSTFTINDACPISTHTITLTAKVGSFEKTITLSHDSALKFTTSPLPTLRYNEFGTILSMGSTIQKYQVYETSSCVDYYHDLKLNFKFETRMGTVLDLGNHLKLTFTETGVTFVKHPNFVKISTTTPFDGSSGFGCGIDTSLRNHETIKLTNEIKFKYLDDYNTVDYNVLKDVSHNEVFDNQAYNSQKSTGLIVTYTDLQGNTLVRNPPESEYNQYFRYSTSDDTSLGISNVGKLTFKKSKVLDSQISARTRCGLLITTSKSLFVNLDMSNPVDYDIDRSGKIDISSSSGQVCFDIWQNSESTPDAFQMKIILDNVKLRVPPTGFFTTKAGINGLVSARTDDYTIQLSALPGFASKNTISKIWEMGQVCVNVIDSGDTSIKVRIIAHKFDGSSFLSAGTISSYSHLFDIGDKSVTRTSYFTFSVSLSRRLTEDEYILQNEYGRRLLTSTTTLRGLPFDFNNDGETTITDCEYYQNEGGYTTFDQSKPYMQSYFSSKGILDSNKKIYFSPMSMFWDSSNVPYSPVASVATWCYKYISELDRVYLYNIQMQCVSNVTIVADFSSYMSTGNVEFKRPPSLSLEVQATLERSGCTGLGTDIVLLTNRNDGTDLYQGTLSTPDSSCIYSITSFTTNFTSVSKVVGVGGQTETGVLPKDDVNYRVIPWSESLNCTLSETTLETQNISFTAGRRSSFGLTVNPVDKKILEYFKESGTIIQKDDSIILIDNSSSISLVRGTLFTNLEIYKGYFVLAPVSINITFSGPRIVLSTPLVVTTSDTYTFSLGYGVNKFINESIGNFDSYEVAGTSIEEDDTYVHIDGTTGTNYLSNMEFDSFMGDKGYLLEPSNGIPTSYIINP